MTYSRRIRTGLAAAIVGLATGLASHAQAVVIDFGSGAYEFPTFQGEVYLEDGFRLSAFDNLGNGVTDPLAPETGHFDIYDPDTYPDFGPERLAGVHTGTSGDRATIDFFGGAFDLVSLEIVTLNDPDTGFWEILASNGSSIIATGAGIVSFDSSFANITSIAIRATSVPDLDDLSGFLEFDNIDVRPVPEPTSAALVVGSLLGLLVARRRGAGTRSS